MSMYSYCMFMYLHRASWHYSATLTEVLPCFFLSCKANVRVKPTNTGHGPHSSKIFVLFYVLFVLCRSLYCLCVNVCTVLLPPGGYPVAVNKYIISCIISGRSRQWQTTYVQLNLPRKSSVGSPGV